MLDARVPLPIADAATCQTQMFADIGHWVAVCKGPDPFSVGLRHDLALGLGVGRSRQSAEQRAIGEMLERLGAGLGGLGAPAQVAAFDQTGRPAGTLPAADVFLPWIAADGIGRPATSDGLAYWTTWRTAAMRAQAEAAERWLLRQVAAGALALVQRDACRIGPYAFRRFRTSRSPRLNIALLATDAGVIHAAGADTSDDGAGALREALLSVLCAEGRVLPSVFGRQDTLLGVHGLTHLDQLGRGAPTGRALPRPRFALACPPAWPARGHFVVRCLLDGVRDG